MLSLAETLAYFVVTGLLVPVAVKLPLPSALALGRFLGRFGYRVLRLRRSVALSNLRFVLGETHTPEQLEAFALESYEQFGMTAIEALRNFRNVDDSGALVEAPPEFDEMVALNKKGQGFIACSPHYGSFERLAYAAAARGLRVAAVMRALENERFDSLIVSCRAAAGVEVLQRGRVSPYALIERLEQGVFLGLLPDQNTRHGVSVDFLGKPARTYRGPAVLHLRSGAPLVVCVIRRLSDDPTRHRVSVRMLPVHQATGDRNADIRAITQRICDAMSELILEAPGQYLWMHRRWGRAASGSGARRHRRRLGRGRKPPESRAPANGR